MQYGVVGLAIAALIAGAAAAASAQGMRPPPAIARVPPFDLKNPETIGEGARLFQQNCTGYCHGKEGRLSRAPSLRGRPFEPDYLYGRIANGWPPMPAYQTIFPPETIWRLVAYIMSLADAKED
jgi:mono/diheme cytochrome c family protein